MMRRLFLEVLAEIERAFRVFEQQVPPPQKKPWKDGFVYRYAEKTIQQALVLKLARCISGLHAVDALLLRGLIQEQASIHRVLDEIQEDIAFLTCAIITGQLTDLHTRYLEAFFTEIFLDPTNTLARQKKPDMVPRRKIQAYVTRVMLKPTNPSLVHDVQENLSNAYSGFVHASAAQIMDMYGSDPPHFHVSGLLGTPNMLKYGRDAWNYFYRGIMNAELIALAFGASELAAEMKAFGKRFAEASGSAANI
jgi:hypothetical protein